MWLRHQRRRQESDHRTADLPDELAAVRAAAQFGGAA
jgi:hypothetical protein